CRSALGSAEVVRVTMRGSMLGAGCRRKQPEPHGATPRFYSLPRQSLRIFPAHHPSAALTLHAW
ncbi:MAG: hypothetical protein ACREOG_03900, partial [Gemmatimonadaceae bacterium]